MREARPSAPAWPARTQTSLIRSSRPRRSRFAMLASAKAPLPHLWRQPTRTAAGDPSSPQTHATEWAQSMDEHMGAPLPAPDSYLSNGNAISLVRSRLDETSPSTASSTTPNLVSIGLDTSLQVSVLSNNAIPPQKPKTPIRV